MANTKLLDDTDRYVQGKLDEVNNPIDRIGSTLTGYIMTRMNNIVTGLMNWSSSKESAQYDIWYQNYLRLASIITKHASQVSSVMKLITNLRANYPNIISIGQDALNIYNNTNGPINQYATTDDADAADDAAVAVAATADDAAVAAAVAAAGVDSNDTNYNLKISNVVLKVILD